MRSGHQALEDMLWLRNKEKIIFCYVLSISKELEDFIGRSGGLHYDCAKKQELSHFKKTTIHLIVQDKHKI